MPALRSLCRGVRTFARRILIPPAGAPNLIGSFVALSYFHMRNFKRLIVLGSVFLFLPVVIHLRAQAESENHFTAANDVTWNSLGTNENDSMPLGNGDVAANVWTEQNGDIVLLLAKSDAWSENCQLLKLGRVRVKLNPNPFAAVGSFAQTLKLESGEVEVQSGKSVARIWVDANQPVVHVEVQTEKATQFEATSEVWRSKSYHLNSKGVSQDGFFEFGNNPDGLDFGADTIFPAQKISVAWCHFNTNSIYPLVFQREHLESLLSKYPDPLLHRCFGITMTGPGFVNSGDQSLKSAHAAKTFRLDLCALTEQTDSPENWRSDSSNLAASIEAVKINSARKAHEQWWAQFWDRSWINISGAPEARKVSQSYAIQRYMTACAGRGAQPIKFNGSLFTVGHDLPDGKSSTDKDHDPDFRAWGASYWNQNTRLIYWPLLASGDDDLLKPWFDMYVRALPLATDRTQLYFHHPGGAFIETIYFWGLPNVNDWGWNNGGPELESTWMRYHIQGGLEVLAEMLDRNDYSGDTDFVRATILPMADAVVTYYDAHWKRGPDGNILMQPSQSIETYQEDAVNPTPDIAGLMSVLPRLIALPKDTTGDARQTLWNRVLKDLPPVPFGTTARGKLPPLGVGDPDGKPTILPAQQYGKPKNHENPELYTVFPYRLYGLGKPNLQLARDTFAARLYPFGKCWGQDGIEAALLLLTDEAKKSLLEEFTSYGNQRFPWFWSKNSDWIPDMDNGGAGMMTLQLMLMQCDGKRIALLPAWPADWTADFKLRAPYQTSVEGHVENGKVTRLNVLPADRAKDVVIVKPTQ